MKKKKSGKVKHAAVVHPISHMSGHEHRVCPACGAELRDLDRCGCCGRSRDQAMMHVAEVLKPRKVTKKKKKKRAVVAKKASKVVESPMSASE